MAAMRHLCIRWKHTRLQTKLYVGLFVVATIWAVMALISMRKDSSAADQSDASRRALHQLASRLQLKFSVISNAKRNHTASISLINPLTDGPLGFGIRWRLYFSLMRPVVLQTSDALSLGFRLTHLNGYLHRLEPVGEVAARGLAPVSQYDIRYVGRHQVISRYDAFPNWYAVLVDASGAETAAEVLSVTAGEGLDFVQPLTRLEQYKAGPDDVSEPWTPFKRAEIQDAYLSGELPSPALARLVPKPVLTEPLKVDADKPVLTDCLLAGLTVSSSSASGESNGCQPAEGSEAARLIQQAAAAAAAAAAGGCSVADGAGSARRWTVRLLVCSSAGGTEALKFASLIKGLTVDQVSEAYELLIDAQAGRVTLSAAQPAGLFWGAQSLVSLLQPGGRLSVGRVFDYPRSPYRGLMLDVARNFMPASEVIRLIDVMSAYKLNRLHLHLSDDEGLRLPLTAAFPAASRRCHPLSLGADSAHPACAQPPQLGSDPNGWDSAPGSGSYSAAQYADILRHAAKRFVRVVPELDTPAHSLAAILAFKAQRTDLTDPEDPGGSPSPQAFSNNSVNPCLPAGSQYILDLLHQVKKLHSEAGQPMLEYHFGGDEAPDGTWTQSPACRRAQGLGPNEPVNADAVIRSNLGRLLDTAAKAGVQSLLGWADGFAGADLRPFNLSSLADSSRRPLRVVAVPWHRRPLPRDLVAAGYSLLMAPADRLYLDHRHEPDPEERGLYWAANFTDLHAVFDYDAAAAVASAGPGADILGMSGALWTETSRQPAQAFGMLAPRVLALAERAWRRADWEAGGASGQRHRDWAEFVSSVGHRELARLARFGVPFRVGPPGARRLGERVRLTHELPGVRLFYSLGRPGPNQRHEWVESDSVEKWPAEVRTVYLMAAYSLPGQKREYFAQSRVVSISR